MLVIICSCTKCWKRINTLLFMKINFNSTYRSRRVAFPIFLKSCLQTWAWISRFNSKKLVYVKLSALFAILFNSLTPDDRASEHSPKNAALRAGCPVWHAARCMVHSLRKVAPSLPHTGSRVLGQSTGHRHCPASHRAPYLHSTCLHKSTLTKEIELILSKV